MLEGLYGASNRQDLPQKRKRAEPIIIDDDEEDIDKKRSTSGRHKGPGIAGEYMKEGRKLALPLNNLSVDLTKDGGDDEVVILREKHQPMQEVCYGLLDARVQAHKIPKPGRNTGLGSYQGSWPAMLCKLIRDPARDMVIRVIDPNDVEFGRLAPEISKGLAPIMDSLGSSLRTQARLMMRKKNPNDWPGLPCSETMGMIINLYGPRKDAERIGKFLGQHNLWFRPPSMADKGVPVVNPHAENREAVARFSLTGNAHPNDNRTVEEAVTAVSRLFDSVAKNAKALPMLDPPSIVTTKLLDHQRQGLWWLLEREKPRIFGDEESENSSLWRRERDDKGYVRYREIVSGIQTIEEPSEVLGGLLADVMGLGKTIEILALLACTMDEARKFGDEKVVRKNVGEQSLLCNTKSTLLVSPLSAVKNWEDQLKEHLKPGKISSYVYHGNNRTQNAYELTKKDIVITTYGTLAADFSKGPSSILHRLKWFRVVLDEAHTIRESKSMQAQAAYSVLASRRWALTGTPIQNRLDDLGSLTQFLKLYPYNTTHGFVQYIRSPASVPGNDNFLKSLRVFVDSFTLRRLKDRVDLPPRHDQICKLHFSEEEKKLHDFFRTEFNVRMEELVEKKKKKKKDRDGGSEYIQVLQGILTLRLISAHGKELLSEKNRAMLKGRSKSEAIDIDDPTATPTFDEKTAYDNLAMMASADMDYCRECTKRIGGDSPADDDEAENIRGYMLPCNDLICQDCFERNRKPFDDAFHGQLIECPFCEMTIRPITIPITAQGLESSRLPSETTKQDQEPAEDLKTTKYYSGPHTKTKALLADLNQMRQDSQPYIDKGEPPLKAVIFSEFTSHLDLIERALTANGFTFVRIDGSMSLAQRRRVLDALSSDNSVTILLASIKAAGQGLNLTAASRAFIMEPMWNPAAEQQAVDRIHRLGQTREVWVKRYQMEDSIEMKIMEIQAKKRMLAEVSLERNHERLGRKEVRERHMRELLSMFK
jgi:SNF2 family DNA or RNA helicase